MEVLHIKDFENLKSVNFFVSNAMPDDKFLFRKIDITVILSPLNKLLIDVAQCAYESARIDKKYRL